VYRQYSITCIRVKASSNRGVKSLVCEVKWLVVLDCCGKTPIWFGCGKLENVDSEKFTRLVQPKVNHEVNKTITFVKYFRTQDYVQKYAKPK
jgi:hypothetical protein